MPVWLPNVNIDLNCTDYFTFQVAQHWCPMVVSPHRPPAQQGRITTGRRQAGTCQRSKQLMTRDNQSSGFAQLTDDANKYHTTTRSSRTQAQSAFIPAGHSVHSPHRTTTWKNGPQPLEDADGNGKLIPADEWRIAIRQLSPSRQLIPHPSSNIFHSGLYSVLHYPFSGGGYLGELQTPKLWASYNVVIQAIFPCLLRVDVIDLSPGQELLTACGVWMRFSLSFIFNFAAEVVHSVKLVETTF